VDVTWCFNFGLYHEINQSTFYLLGAVGFPVFRRRIRTIGVWFQFHFRFTFQPTLFFRYHNWNSRDTVGFINILENIDFIYVQIAFQRQHTFSVDMPGISGACTCRYHIVRHIYSNTRLFGLYSDGRNLQKLYLNKGYCIFWLYLCILRMLMHCNGIPMPYLHTPNKVPRLHRYCGNHWGVLKNHFRISPNWVSDAGAGYLVSLVLHGH